MPRALACHARLLIRRGSGPRRSGLPIRSSPKSGAPTRNTRHRQRLRHHEPDGMCRRSIFKNRGGPSAAPTPASSSRTTTSRRARLHRLVLQAGRPPEWTTCSIPAPFAAYGPAHAKTGGDVTGGCQLAGGTPARRRQTEQAAAGLISASGGIGAVVDYTPVSAPQQPRQRRRVSRRCSVARDTAGHRAAAASFHQLGGPRKHLCRRSASFPPSLRRHALGLQPAA